MKTLIVDDELVSRMKLKIIFEKFGPCQVVENGREAITAFKDAWKQAEPFDLLCLDVSMPEMDGTEVLFEIREAETALKVTREKPVKVFMITSRRDKDTIITSIQAGCDDYIVKPFDPQLIWKKVEKLGFPLKA